MICAKALFRQEHHQVDNRLEPRKHSGLAGANAFAASLAPIRQPPGRHSVRISHGGVRNAGQ